MDLYPPLLQPNEAGETTGRMTWAEVGERPKGGSFWWRVRAPGAWGSGSGSNSAWEQDAAGQP